MDSLAAWGLRNPIGPAAVAPPHVAASDEFFLAFFRVVLDVGILSLYEAFLVPAFFAVVAVARKLLTIAYGVLKYRAAHDPAKLLAAEIHRPVKTYRLVAAR